MFTGTLYLRAAVQRRGQRPPKGSGTNMTVEATQRQKNTHVNMRRIHTGQKKEEKKKKKRESEREKKEEEEYRLDSNDCGFICAGVNFVDGYK